MRLPVVLALSTALSTAFCGTAYAQQEGQISGDALNVPAYNAVDGNGVDLLSGRFHVQSPVLSMGSAERPARFYFTWSGQGWLPNTPRIWLDKDWHVIVEDDGISDEFANATQQTESVQLPPPGTRLVYTQIRPNSGAALACYFTGGLSGSGWFDQCKYTSRNGVTISFMGNLVYNGNYPQNARFDNEAYGNTRAWPSQKFDPAEGLTTYLIDQPVQIQAGSNGGDIKIWRPDGYTVAKTGTYYSQSITFTMSTYLGADISMVVQTPSLSGNDSTKSYLRPKSTTQTFTDALGRMTSYTFNSNGDMTRVMSPEGVTEDIAYDGSHRVTDVTRNGSHWGYSYNFSDGSTGAGKTTVTDPANKSRRVAHQAKPGPVTSVIDELTHTTLFGYDSYTRLTDITRQDNDGAHYDYDARGNIISASTIPKSAIGGAPLVTTAEYEPGCGNIRTCNKPIKITDPRGNATDITYDSGSGLPLTITGPADSNGIRPQTRNTYTTLFGSFSVGSTQVFRSVPRLTQVSICRTQASCANSADEVRTIFGYGYSQVLPLYLTKELGDGTPLGTVKTFYDGFRNVSEVDGPLPGSDDATEFHFDAAQQKTGEVSPDPDGPGPLVSQASHTSYNFDGQPILIERGTVPDHTNTGWTLFTPSQLVANQYLQGRLVEVASGTTASTATVIQNSYDAFGRVQCSTIRMNLSSFPSIAANGVISGGTLPASACTPDTAVGPDGPDRITVNSYDELGRVASIQKGIGTPQAQTYAAYTYSINGKQTSATDANLNRATYTYDGFDRLIAWSFPSKTNGAEPASCTIGPITEVNGITGPSAASNSVDDCEKYYYDRNGNRATVMKRDARTINYTYDALNRVTSKTFVAGGACVLYFACTTPPPGAVRDVYYNYDLRDLKTEARFDSTVGTDNIISSYDPLGRLQSSTTSMGGYSRTLSYQYDLAGNRTQITHPDVTPTYFTSTYDFMNRLSTSSINGATQFLSIAYDAQGRRVLTARGASQTSYNNYDLVSRLLSDTQVFTDSTSNTTGTYGYNAASQIVSQARSNDAFAFASYATTNNAYTTNGLNQYTVVAGGSLGYDANGNLASTGATNFTYDVENRLVLAEGTKNASLVYDPNGRLWQTSGGGFGTTQFLYDGDELIGEYNGAGTLLRRYVHGPGVDEPVMWAEGSLLTDLRFYHPDHQGSIVATANAAGARFETYTYDEYGVPNTHNYDNKGRFQYAGQTWIPELAMYYYKARIYSSRLGRFLQTDPIGYTDQMNLYAYVGNDPINETDPTGEEMGAAVKWEWDQANRGRRPQRAPFLRKVAGGALRLVAAVTRDPVAAAKSVGDFTRNYFNMRDADTHGADKFFHCTANCEAASRGTAGSVVAEKISNAREVTDQRIKGDPRSASEADQAANRAGRAAGARASADFLRENLQSSLAPLPPPPNVCPAACNQFRPNGLPPRF